MSITIKNYIRNAILVLLLLVPFVVASPASAQIEQGLCGGINLQTSGCTPDGAGATNRVNNIMKLIINIFSIIVGIVAVIMIIVGGLKYITSGGDSNNVTSAKNTILYAIIGLIIVALAQVIVRFVLAQGTGDSPTIDG